MSEDNVTAPFLVLRPFSSLHAAYVLSYRFDVDEAQHEDYQLR